MTQLEAFAQIARAVGGETELRAVLDRILANGRAIIGARTLVAYLEQEGELVAAASTDESLAGLPARLDSTEQLMRPATWSSACAGRGRRSARSWPSPRRDRASTTRRTS